MLLHDSGGQTPDHRLPTTAAAATIIDINGQIQAAVSIVASGVVFGAPQGGFTMTGSLLGGGLVIDADERVRVAIGNMARGNNGPDGFSAVRGTHHRLIDNVSTENGHGFGVFSTHTVLRNNVAAHNIANGFRVHASQNVYVGNRAISNGEWGFCLRRWRAVSREPKRRDRQPRRRDFRRSGGERRSSLRRPTSMGMDLPRPFSSTAAFEPVAARSLKRQTTSGARAADPAQILPIQCVET